jgi:hypothetical protein
MGITGVHAALGLDYIRMENKLLEKNISRVLSMVGKDGRTVWAVLIWLLFAFFFPCHLK